MRKVVHFQNEAMVKEFPNKTCDRPTTREDLQDNIQSFTSCQGQSDCVNAVQNIATCLGLKDFYGSPPLQYHQRRRG